MATSPAPNGPLRAVPPRPRTAPTPRQPAGNRTNNVNIKLPDLGSLPPLTFSVNKTTVVNGGHQAAANNRTEAPGSDFASNEDIHAYANHGRRLARDRSTTTALDAEALFTVLRHIPSADGSMAGARIRASKVSRNLKKIAAAERLIAKLYVALYASFQREYEAELNKIGRGRVHKAPRTPFQWS